MPVDRPASWVELYSRSRATDSDEARHKALLDDSITRPASVQEAVHLIHG